MSAKIAAGNFRQWTTRMRLAAFGLALLGSTVAVAMGARAAGPGAPGLHAPDSGTPIDVAELPSEPARLASVSLLLDLADAGRSLVAVGERGHALLSDDAGRNWIQTQTPTQALLTGVCFADAQHGIAVGHDEIILTSPDGGHSWKRTHFAPQAQQPLLDVWCGPEGRAVAVGAYGVYMLSKDYGATWAEHKLEPTNEKPDKGRAAGAKDIGGAIGAKARSAAGAKAGSAAGADAADLTDEIVGGYHLNAIAADEQLRLYIAAEAGHLYRSDDRGETWIALPSPYAGSLFGVLPLPGGAVLAYGLRGNLFRSADAGATWQRVATDTKATLDGGAALGGGRVVVVGLSGVLLFSRDGGASFSPLQQDDRKGLAAVRGVPGNTLVIVGEAGVKLIMEPRP
jgi:photosystem II stability/assembly factor-like uncharacterized protein